MHKFLAPSVLVPVRPAHCRFVVLRAGLSLLEVVLGTAILAMALAVLAQQSATGVRAALRCQMLSDAAIHCQTQMDRMLAGLLPFQAVQNQPIENAAGWRWSAEIRSSSIPDLLELRIEVYQETQPVLSRCRLFRLVAVSGQAAAGISVTSAAGSMQSGGGR
jgi:type II secretory pathway pseudopilin PulG